MKNLEAARPFRGSTRILRLWMLGAAAMPATVYAQAAPQSEEAIPEIVVTAQKRAERIQDVPLSITALGTDAIEKRGYSRMGDYLLAQPSVVILDSGAGRNTVVIRGVAAPGSTGNPTVAFYIGETPVTNGLGFGANGFPDLRTFDVERVEVLRGPQGTLYGAGSMGGTIKVVPAEALIGEWQVKGEASVASTAHGGISHNVAGALNLPLGETLAARVTAYHYRDAGFIDNYFSGSPDPDQPVAALGGASWTDVGVSAFGVPARDDENANSTDIRGGRASLTFKPNDQFKFVVGALYQRAVADGLPENLPLAGDYVQSRMTQERLKDSFQLYNATATVDLDVATITSATAYLTREQLQSRDVSAYFLGGPIVLPDDNKSKAFSQEIRVATDPDKPLSVLFGGFFLHSKSNVLQDLQWLGTPASRSEYAAVLTGTSLGPDDIFYRFTERNKADQLAAFGEIAVKPVDTVRISAGLRIAKFERTTSGFAEGALNGGTDSYIIKASESVKTPNFQIEFKPDRNSLYYVRAAKGFRLGVPNNPLPSTCAADLAALGLTEVPASVKSDTLWNYEAGIKRTFAGGRASFNASAFYIDWTDIQTGFVLPTCGFSFSGNAGKATSKGVELDFTVRPFSSVTINASGSFTDAKLETDSPPGNGVGGRKGDRLPGIPRWSVQAGVQYDFSLFEREGFARVDGKYLSGYFNRFPGATATAEPGGDFAVFDARLGLDITPKIQAEVFASNIFDTKQLLIVDTEIPDNRELLGRPRTIGATIRLNF
ncbi:TonB-dependent receptor [Sphingopyxis fribergensis]